MLRLALWSFGVVLLSVGCTPPPPFAMQDPALVHLSPLEGLSTNVRSSFVWVDVWFSGIADPSALIGAMIDTARLEDASGARIDGVTVESGLSDPGPGLSVDLPRPLPEGWLRLSFDADQLASVANRSAFFWSGSTASVWLRQGEQPLLRAVSRCQYAKDEVVWTFSFSEPVRYGSTDASGLVSLVEGGAPVEGCRVLDGLDLSLWEGALIITCPGDRTPAATDFTLRGVSSAGGVVLGRTRDRAAAGTIVWSDPAVWQDLSCDTWFEDMAPVASP